MCQIVELRKEMEMINYIERFLEKGNKNKFAWENTSFYTQYLKRLNEDDERKGNTYPKSVL